MQTNLIQIAGIKDLDEARKLIKLGADQIGFPLRLTHNAEDLSDQEARSIIKKINKPDKFLLITYLTEPGEIIKLCKFLNIHKVQLHNHMTTHNLAKLKNQAPNIEIIKSLIIKAGNLPDIKKYINNSAQYIDYYITDTYDPDTGASGATGKTHDWEISRKIVEHSPKPVILAGGLTPKNVRQAILEVQPAGVDAHTGLEDSQGRKDYELVENFIREVRQAFAKLSQKEHQIDINGVLDLHTFQPSDVKDLVPEYINECIRKNISDIRIIHGKGRGVLKKIVSSILSKHPRVISYKIAPERGGNWGATVAKLKLNNKKGSTDEKSN